MREGIPLRGEMPEWSKGAVSKTVEGYPSEGSNPSLSAFPHFPPPDGEGM
jgi:hypothetical protein